MSLINFTGTKPNSVKLDLSSVGMGVLEGQGKQWLPSFPYFVDHNNELAKYWRVMITPHRNYPNGMCEAGI